MDINHGGTIMTMIKSTVNIDKYYKEQLEYLVSINELNSVTEGINIAIAEYVKDKQKALYAQQMRQAAQDPAFINRTMTAQKDFEKIETIDLSKDSEW